MNLGVMYSGDPAAARPHLREAFEIARRFKEPTAMAMSRVALGQCEIMLGDVSGGLSLLDEAMAIVASGGVNPIFVGIAYCATIGACQDVFDARRAREWTSALSRWCDEQQGLVPFRGNCLVHRCEIFQLHGEWSRAQDAAEAACELLAGPPPWDILGYAAFSLGELLRLQGDAPGAEDAYRRASRFGHDPEPGMSRLLLAQGRTDQAALTIKRVLDERHDPPSRARSLPAAVEILLAAGDVADARVCADELDRLAGEMGGAPLLAGSADHAAGSVLLAEGRAREALVRLRAAADTWRTLDVPYEMARTRTAIGLACASVGDTTTADLEFEAARTVFAELGASPDVARLELLSGGGRKTAPGGLTGREIEVLRLVATGNTNRGIASELVLSEKTVARHVANIFTKLGVTSRSGATAWAYEHHLL
jgi:DNA-binding CsgD family transcriptional regulator